MMKKFFDLLEIWCYLLNMPKIARFFARFGTPALPRPTRPVDGRDYRKDFKVPISYDPNMIAFGPNWSLVELDYEPIKVIDFDSTFNKNADIDVLHDIVIPTSKFDIN
jgi:hypothetical protein